MIWLVYLSRNKIKFYFDMCIHIFVCKMHQWIIPSYECLMWKERTLFNLPQLWYTTSIKYMFIVLFVLLFYIVHCCIDIEDRSLSGLYFNKIISCLCRIAACFRFSNLNMSRFLFLKVKLTYIATEIQLSYPEWIATCIQLKNLEKYLSLLNRNLAKCKEMGSFFSIGVTNRRFALSNTFLAIRLLVGDVFPNSMRPV
jgi:hypothetical protein